MGSPASAVLRGAPTPPRPSRASLVVPRRPGTSRSGAWFAPQGHAPDGVPSAWTFSSGVPTRWFFREEAGRPPRFLGNPFGNVLRSATPVEGWRLDQPAGVTLLPSAFRTASASTMIRISGLNHAARSLAVYASQTGSPHARARLASGWPGLPWPGGTLTRWVPMLSFKAAWRPPVPSAQAWPGAPDVPVSRTARRRRPPCRRQQPPEPCPHRQRRSPSPRPGP